MPAWFKNLSLSGQIFTSLALGIAFGLVLRGIASTSPDAAAAITNYIAPAFGLVKQLFVNALKMVVVPLVLVSLICGTCSLSDPKKLGTLGGKSIALYLMTTAIAISLALFLATLFDPGANVVITDTSFEAKNAPSIGQVLGNLVSSNPFESLASGNMLQVIIFAILFGVAISRAGENGKKVADFFNAMNEVVLKLVTIIMHIAPYGVFCIMSLVILETGVDRILELGVYFILVAITLILHAALTYPTLLVIFAKLNPITMLIKIRPAWLFAFSTSSSAATLPVTMEIARKRLGVGKTTASFTLPLGATINMDGTAIMQGVATVFIAQLYGVDLNATQYLTVILMATLASIGTAGVPSVGLLMLSIVLAQVNLPAEAVAMLLGIDRLLDMMRTVVNITGDMTVACIVSKSENDFDNDVFTDPKAGFEFESASKTS